MGVLLTLSTRRSIEPMIQTPEGFVPDFHSRYFTEDFPYGMRYIVDLAQKNNVDIPVIQTVFDWGIRIASLSIH